MSTLAAADHPFRAKPMTCLATASAPWVITEVELLRCLELTALAPEELKAVDLQLPNGVFVDHTGEALAGVI